MFTLHHLCRGQRLDADGFQVDFGIKVVGASSSSTGIAVGGDGACFVIHNDPRGTAASGGWGGALGYAAGANSFGTAIAGITNGMCVRMDQLSAPSLGMNVGPAAMPDQGQYSTAGVFDWAAGIEYFLSVRYFQDQRNLTVLVSDGGAPRSYNFTVDLRSALGCAANVQGCQAYFGFTAAGALSYGSYQVTSFNYRNTYPTNTPTVSEPMIYSMEEAHQLPAAFFQFNNGL